MFAIAGLINRWIGTSFWPGAICASFVAEIPLVSHILAIWGGIIHYGMAWYWSAIAFAPEISLGITSGMIICLVKATIATIQLPTSRLYRGIIGIIIATIIGFVGYGIAISAIVPDLVEFGTYQSNGESHAIRSGGHGRHARLEIDCFYIVYDYDRMNPPDGLYIGESEETGTATILLHGAQSITEFCNWLDRMQTFATTNGLTMAIADDYIKIHAKIPTHGQQKLYLTAQCISARDFRPETLVIPTARFFPRGKKRNREATLLLILATPSIETATSPSELADIIRAGNLL